MMIRCNMRIIYFTLLLVVGTATRCSAQFCVTRFVGGKWTKKGNCGGKSTISDVARDIQTAAKADEQPSAPVIPISFRRDLPKRDESDVITPKPTHDICRNVSFDPTGSSNSTGGVYKYKVPGIGRKELYCDMKTDGGNWIVFQRRIDGSTNFNRTWNDYVKGFGDLTREFWLGLETIHRITNMGNHELRIDFVDKNGTYYIAKYSSFGVGNSSDKYRLHLAGYSGNSTNTLANPDKPEKSLNNQQFSTRDADNDVSVYDRNCAAKYGGGWWFQRCTRTNLNRPFDSIVWQIQSGQKGHVRLVSTEMKFRQAL